MSKRILIFLFSIFSLLLTTSCEKAKLGTESNPLKLWLMPLKSESVFKENAPVLEAFLEEKTGLSVEVKLAPSFIDTVKAFGKKKADAAFMNTLGYLLAHDWASAKAKLQYVYGDVQKDYRGEIVARVGSNINKPEDLNGKTFAFADKYSASGYLYALDYLQKNNIKPSKTIFAGGHLRAIEMVYKGEVDAAATYHDWPLQSGSPNDARIELKHKYPDILSVIRIIALTDDIPNGPVAVRKDLPEDVSKKLISALLEFANTQEGRTTLMNLYTMTGLTPVSDSAYNEVRTVIKKLGKTIQMMVPGGDPYYKTSIEIGLE